MTYEDKRWLVGIIGTNLAAIAILLVLKAVFGTPSGVTFGMATGIIIYDAVRYVERFGWPGR